MSEDDEILYEMQEIMTENPIVKEKFRMIKNTNIYANSVNVYVGRPRSGKTFQAIHDIISVIRNDNCAHLLVYINESGKSDDETFERFDDLLDIPIVFIRYDNYERYLKKLLDYKDIYNKIKKTCCENEVPDNVRSELFNNLHIDDFDKPHLHTLIITEDATNAKPLRKADSYLNDLLTRCAHTQFSFFILIHYWKALTPNIKANLSMIYIFGGYSRQQLAYMLYQMNIPITLKELMHYYMQMPQYAKIIIDTYQCDFNIV